MRVRWLLVLLLVLAGQVQADPGPRVLVLGFDGMDPILLAKFRAEGLMPNFDRFLADGGQLTPFGTSTPPQSPVAWSNFITGMDPGGHGIFDFIHRDPKTLLPYFSASEAKGPTRFWKFRDWKIPRGSGEVRNLRHGTAFWELLAEHGIDATIFKVPANFPPVACEVRSLAGMGTPDLTGNYGISTLITDDPPENRDLGGGRVVSVYLEQGRFQADLEGPPNAYHKGDPPSLVNVTGHVDQTNQAVWLEVDGHKVVLDEGQWSDWVPISFPLVPLLKSVAGICRFYLMDTDPLRLYVTPIQIDPEHPEMPISTPESYSKQIVQQTGLFYTQGLPDDTSALENGFFDDGDYVQQSELVLQERVRQLGAELDRFAALPEGFLFFYFNSPDQTCHMTWRNMDASSPTHATADMNQSERIAHVYGELDSALGLALDRMPDDTLVMVMSDHGFAPWNRAFNLNTWLLQNGYLVLEPGYEAADVKMLIGVDWSRTRAYAIGINGLYLNLAGREFGGIVQPGGSEQALLSELKTKLEQVVDPLDGRPAIRVADRSDEVYHGNERAIGPDIVVGYYRGWRGSNESALGEVPAEVFTDNMLKWSGDHCIAAAEVPGILMANRPLLRENPALVDMAPTILKLFGITPPPEMVGGSVFEKR